MTLGSEAIRDHRLYVAGHWDTPGGDGLVQFELLKHYGLEPHHRVLDFGCGSLRIGRHLIPYLDRDRYFGIDPNRWLIDAGLEREIPPELVEEKSPQFSYNADFDASVFDLAFDVVFAHAVLTHACHRQINVLMRSLPAALKDDGFLAGDICGKKPDYQADCWSYPASVHHLKACVRRVPDTLGYGFEWIPRKLTKPLERKWFRIGRRL